MEFSSAELEKAKSAYSAVKCACNPSRADRRKDAKGEFIELKLTFEEWLKIWLDSGHWHERGVKAGGYVMARNNDIGHYELGNVDIVPRDVNIRTALVGKPNKRKGTTGGTSTLRGSQQDLVTCPHCSLTGGVNAMTRRHFDNCKLKPNR